MSIENQSKIGTMVCLECRGELTKVDDGFSCPKCGAHYTGASGEVIQTIYAFVGNDPKTNVEGFISYQARNGQTIMAVGTNPGWAEKNSPDFEEMAKRAGLEIRLVKFTGREVIRRLGKTG